MRSHFKKFVPSHVILNRLDAQDLRFERAAKAKADRLAMQLAAFRARTGGAPIVDVTLEPKADQAGPVVDVTLAPKDGAK